MITLTSKEKQIAFAYIKGMKVRKGIQQAKKEFQNIISQLQLPDHSEKVDIEYSKLKRFQFTIIDKSSLSFKQSQAEDQKLQRIQILRKRRKQIKQRIKWIDKTIKEKQTKSNL